MSSEAKPVKLDVLFNQMPELGASDLHLKAGNPPIYRLAGELHRTKVEPLTEKQISSLVEEWLGNERMAELYREGSLDLGHNFGRGRVRVNVFLQRGTISLAARLVSDTIPSLEQLHLPSRLERIVQMKQGLILVCGITGSGKSTTLACLVEMINKKRRCHILTIEDPIEYLHTDARSIVNQRELGLDCHNWADAVRAAVREDPDVILVGEMRDQETFQAGLVAAETGHLVFGTLHTASAVGTVGRILDLFPAEKHRLIRQALALNLRSIICQMLLPSYQEELTVVPVVELLFGTPPVRKAIDEGEDGRIHDLIASGSEEGMQSWTQSFVDMLKRGFIEKKVALDYAPNKDALEMALKGIDVSERAFG
ncbi:MAG: type IV pilus twitching motility protein PilT [Planctomycetota bacterium]|jgi:twitching motility protein PilT